MHVQARWARAAPSPETWRPSPGQPHERAVAEQDRAAGGRLRRSVLLDDGQTATASVELKMPGGRRIYGYLRYSRDGQTVNRYVGNAPGKTRQERLAHVWRLARKRGMLNGA